MKLQWDECILLKGTKDITEYFTNDRKKLFVLGKGFDPRMCKGIEVVKNADRNMDIVLIKYNEISKSTSKEYISDSDANLKEFENITVGMNVRMLAFSMWKVSDAGKTSQVKKYLESEFSVEKLQQYEEIIVDMSAMPRSIYAVLIRILNKRKGQAKLSIIACENSILDDSITPTNTFEEAVYLNGVGAFNIGSEANNDKTMVWFPMLGTGSTETVKKLADFLKPAEICPIVPFPSADVKRSDKILLKYKDVLFDSLGVETKNILHVSENNPILIYKKICTAVFYYSEALSVLNRKENTKDTKFVFSMQSSKLMELGLLLAVFELLDNHYMVGIAVVENEGYKMDRQQYDESKNVLYCVCLDANIYE